MDTFFFLGVKGDKQMGLIALMNAKNNGMVVGCLITCFACIDKVTPCDNCKRRIHEAWHKIGVKHVWNKYCSLRCKNENIDIERSEIERLRNIPRLIVSSKDRKYKKIKGEIIPL